MADEADEPQPRFDLPAVVLISAIFFFVKLGSRPLADWDEAIYGDIAREFARGVSHIVPYWNYRPWLERTPLFEWVTAFLFSLFGVSEFWERAASAVCGCATVGLTFVLAREMYSRYTAWIAALILLCTHGFFYQARFGTTDMMLTLWMTVSVYGIYHVSQRDQQGWYLFWIGLALAIMTKSAAPAPVVITLAIVAVTQKWKSGWFGQPSEMGSFLFLLLVVPWHAYMFVTFGKSFFDDYIGRQLLARSVQPLEGHVGGPLFYIVHIAKSAFP
ncbi:MAG: glycosyltransferase family 39 protein, partial [Acidobacteriaceae bacterium]|nr:glycosyltransferase family 39 protein [Acidobacteriaceae bacterium]